jgi:oligopeptide transport system substrate-binding protein
MEIAPSLNGIAIGSKTCASAYKANLRPKILCSALATLLLFLTACANQQSPALAPAPAITVSSELATDQVINRHLEADPRSLDPSLAEAVVDQIVLQDLFEGLVTLAEDGSTIPGAASSWETSADGKTWTFHLRKNSKWSNGAPVTADDFVYAWRRLVDPATGSEYSQALAPIENALDIASGNAPVSKLGVESAGPQTLIVHLHAPTAYLLGLLANMYMYPIYAPAVKQWGETWTQPGHMIGNGAFTLSDRVINGHITLLKNPLYRDADHVRLTRVNYVVVSDYDAAMNRYLSGDLDFTDRVTSSQKIRLQRLLGDQVVIEPTFAQTFFSFNMMKPPFSNNPKLRMALDVALDRDILSKYVRRGIDIPGYSIMPPLPGYDPVVPNWAKLSTEDRHALARKLYQEAGYSDKHPLETLLTYPSAGADVRQYMEALSAMWLTTLGAHIQIYNVEFKVLLQMKQQKEPVFYWDAWFGDFPDPFTFMQLFQTGNGMNDGDYSNPRYDALIDQASNTNDQAVRYQLFHQAEAILEEDVPTIPVYTWSSTHLIKPYVKGWQSNVMDRNLSQYMYILAHKES